MTNVPQLSMPTAVLYLQGAAPNRGATADTSTANPAPVVTVDGFNGAQIVEILELAGGTADVQLQGSMDGTYWHDLGYQQTDGEATLARSVSVISVAANSGHVYQLLDPYRFLVAVLSSVSGASVLARVYGVPA